MSCRSRYTIISSVIFFITPKPVQKVGHLKYSASLHQSTSQTVRSGLHRELRERMSSSDEDMFTSAHVDELLDARGVCEYVIEGKSEVPSDNLVLFFRNPVSKEAHAIDLSQDPGTSISTLLGACSPAAFGRGSQGVLDPSYRRALKLDSTDFAINFSPERLGIVNQIEKRLGNSPFEKEKKPRKVYAELYKLNCYSQGGFFKAHKDTPRAANMLGSLVVNLPTVHSGGELVIRSGDGTEHICDWSQSEVSNVCSWAAFYSDMEHEIYPVTMGHRITLTYNIYFQEEETHTTGIPLGDLNKHPFFITLNRLINEDPTFLPYGGVIISFLAHEYPNFRLKGCGKLAQELTHFLKGNDRALFQIAEALNLFPETKALIPGSSAADSGFTVLSDTSGIYGSLEYDGDPSLDHILLSQIDTERGDFRDGDGDWETRVLFLNRGSEAGTEWEEHYATYGNEPSIDFVYVQAILVMHVRPWEEVGGGRNRSSPEEI